MGVEENIDLIGYSLGGGVAAHYAGITPTESTAWFSLAPYFQELAADDFLSAIDSGTGAIFMAGKPWRK